MHFFLHFFAKKFGHIKKKQYLCTRFRKERQMAFLENDDLLH